MTTPEVVDAGNGWSLVRCGCWEVSVGPDGLLQLPRSLAPEEVTDFVAACQAAAEVGTAIVERNTADSATATPAMARFASTPEGDAAETPVVTASGLVIAASGEAPAAGVRITKPGGTPSQPQGFSAIGRRLNPRV